MLRLVSDNETIAPAVLPAGNLTVLRYVLTEGMSVSVPARLLLLTLLAVADDGLCAPSIAWLISRTGLSPDDIRDGLAELEAEGYLDISARVSGALYSTRRLAQQAAAWSMEYHGGDPDADEVQDIDPADFDGAA